MLGRALWGGGNINTVETVETHLHTHPHNDNHRHTQRQTKDNNWGPYPETVILQLMFLLDSLSNLIPSSCRVPCSSQPVRPPATVFRPADNLQREAHGYVNHIPLTHPKPWQTSRGHNSQTGNGDGAKVDHRDKHRNQKVRSYYLFIHVSLKRYKKKAEVRDNTYLTFFRVVHLWMRLMILSAQRSVKLFTFSLTSSSPCKEYSDSIKLHKCLSTSGSLKVKISWNS